MSQHSDKPGFYGVHHDVIAAAMRRARRERSEAVWAILRRLLGGNSRRGEAGSAHVPAGGCVG